MDKIKNSNPKKNIKLKFLSGILSIILISLLLTGFELAYFYLIQLNTVKEFNKYNISKITKYLNKELKKYKPNPNYCKNINDSLPIKDHYASFYGYHLFRTSNNNNIIKTIVFLFILFVFLIILVLVIMKNKSIKLKQKLKNSISYNFISSTLLTILLIIGFQVFFRLKIVDKYNFLSSYDFDRIIYKVLK